MPHMNPGMLGTVSTGHHNLYETHLEAYLKPVAQVSVKCGIHVRAIERKNERGALSPLLVLHWAKPSSETITKNGERCWFRSRTTVIHLFYMDKIKLYAKSEQQSWLIDPDHQDLQQWHQNVIWPGCEVWSDGVKEGEPQMGWIARREHNRYRQLHFSWDPAGKWEPWGTCKESSHSQIPTERLRRVLKSQPNGKNKVRAIETYTPLIIRCPAGIRTWLKDEIEPTGIKTRKLFSVNGEFHPKLSFLRP